jgi:peroxiredoxin
MNKIKLLLAASMLMLIAAMVPALAQGYNAGDKARDFRLKNVDGNMVSMKDNQAAKGYILVFTCNHCPFSVKYEDRIIALHKKYAPMGYPVIAINPNDPGKQPEDSFDNIKKRASDKSFPFPYLIDEMQEIAKAYGATRTPHVYIVKKTGNDYVVEYIGAIDDNSNDASKVQRRYVEEAMGDILAGRAVANKNTKAIGCTIKWRDA